LQAKNKYLNGRGTLEESDTTLGKKQGKSVSLIEAARETDESDEKLKKRGGKSQTKDFLFK